MLDAILVREVKEKLKGYNYPKEHLKKLGLKKKWRDELPDEVLRIIVVQTKYTIESHTGISFD